MEMNAPPFKSDSFYPGFMRASLVALAVMCLASGALFVSQDGHAGLFAIVVGALLLVVHRASRGKFGVVTAGDEGLQIAQNRATILLDWSDVRGLGSIPFVFPAVYRLTYSKEPFVTYFVAPSFLSIHIGIWSWEFSAMARYIRNRCRSQGTVGR